MTRDEYIMCTGFIFGKIMSTHAEFKVKDITEDQILDAADAAYEAIVEGSLTGKTSDSESEDSRFES